MRRKIDTIIVNNILRVNVYETDGLRYVRLDDLPKSMREKFLCWHEYEGATCPVIREENCDCIYSSLFVRFSNGIYTGKLAEESSQQWLKRIKEYEEVNGPIQ